MLQIVGKTLGITFTVLCLVSTLAMATEMTCTKDNGMGTCMAATGPDGQTVVVVGDGLKVGEQMDCVDRGNMIACQALILASPPPVPFEMICTKDNGMGTCMAATGPDNKTVIVVGEGAKTGEKMTCVDRGSLIACQAMSCTPLSGSFGENMKQVQYFSTVGFRTVATANPTGVSHGARPPV